jgi:hypothetical protein
VPREFWPGTETGDRVIWVIRKGGGWLSVLGQGLRTEVHAGLVPGPTRNDVDQAPKEGEPGDLGNPSGRAVAHSFSRKLPDDPSEVPGYFPPREVGGSAKNLMMKVWFVQFDSLAVIVSNPSFTV